VTRRSEIGAVYAAGVVQGVALVTFPAASTILTSPDYYGLSSTAYGGLFLPQAVTAIGSALLGARLTRRLGLKRVFLLGLAADLVSMTVLLLSQAVMTVQPLAYVLLLLATAALGAGFGLTVPALNTFAADFFPQQIGRAVLFLNALLGLGTALAPVIAALFVGLGIWWGLPLLVAVLLVVLLVFGLPLPLTVEAPETVAGGGSPARPTRFWIFAAFALLYGVVETVNGNWATLYMTSDVGTSATVASLALTAFWAMVTVGRVLFAAVERWLPERRTYRLLPFLAAAALAAVAALPTGDPALGVLAFGLAGLGCSALLPLTISFGQAELTAMAASVASGLIAFYQMGYGLAAFGVGPLVEHTGLGLSAIYGLAAAVALAMGALAFVVVPRGGPATPDATAPATERLPIRQ
jgi:MFS family permease